MFHNIIPLNLHNLEINTFFFKYPVWMEKGMKFVSVLGSLIQTAAWLQLTLNSATCIAGWFASCWLNGRKWGCDKCSSIANALHSMAPQSDEGSPQTSKHKQSNSIALPPRKTFPSLCVMTLADFSCPVVSILHLHPSQCYSSSYLSVEVISAKGEAKEKILHLSWK